MPIELKKGDCVKIDAYSTGYGMGLELRGIVVAYDEWCDTADVFVVDGRGWRGRASNNGVVSIFPRSHLEKIDPQ